MAGGLIQLVTYGSQDLYLTGTPQITFFKVVYRRHTNFSMESVFTNFDTSIGFGKESTITIPKTGDLIHKIYLQITLPEIHFFRNHQSDQTIKDNYRSALNDYYGGGNGIIISFMQLNRNAYVLAYNDYITSNITDPSGTITNIQNLFYNNSVDTFFIFFMSNPPAYYPILPYTYNEVSMNIIASQFNSNSSMTTFFNALSIGIDKMIRLQDFFMNNLLNLDAIYKDDINEYLKFAWVSKIGHSLIDYVEILIGGNRIDKHYGDWINIWHELSGDIHKEDLYNDLIGNIDILTSFNRETKPSYVLNIPLQFWFCRHSGLSIPIVALEYQEITLNVKFRNLEQVSYIENNETILYNNTNVYLNEVPTEFNIDITANLLIDYIYLDSSERRRFAQSSHEYLIDQIQVLEQKNITQPSFQFNLNNFVYPSKEIIWVAQKVSYTVNDTGYVKLQWDNYTISDEYFGNCVDTANLTFNGYTRIENNTGNYFNYLQPYESHSKTPANGTNMYSFSIFPEEIQPSGTSNMSRLSKIVLSINFNSDFVYNGKLVEPLNLRVYTRSLNILRFINGFGVPAYTYG
jgi:hypothetical protein